MPLRVPVVGVAHLGCGLLWAVCAAGAAQPITPAATVTPAEGGLRFPITAFQVEGDLPLPPAVVNTILSPYLQPDATQNTLGAATDAVEQALRSAGWGLYRLALPPQELNGPVRLRALRFELGQVEVQGNSRRSGQQVLQALPVLRPGSTPNLHSLAVQTALANDNPGRHLQVTLKASDQEDRVDAVVQVTEEPDVSVNVLWANTGNASSGRDRMTGVLSHHNLWGLDHQAQVAYTSSLAQPSRVSQWGVLYRVPVPERAEVWGVSASSSDVVGDFGAFTSQGGGYSLGLSWLRHNPPQGQRRSWWSAALDAKWFAAGQTTAAGVVVPSTARSRLSVPLALGYHARWSDGPVQTAAGVDAVVQVGGAGRLAAYQTENPGLSQTRWWAWRAHASHRQPLGAAWQLEARAQGQWASTALLAGEQFGVGGSQSVRGMPERPLAADNGLQATLELSHALGPPSWRGLLFADAAWLHNHAAAATGRVPRDHVASVGWGVRFSDQSRRQVALSYGHVFNGSAAPFTSSPRRGDNRWHVSAAMRF